MAKAFGIVSFAGNHVRVDGLRAYRPAGAFSFLGRYRIIDFPISNMSNSGIDQIQVYIRRQPRSLAEHLGSGRHYNINSKRGKLQLLFTENSLGQDFYNTGNRRCMGRYSRSYSDDQCSEAESYDQC